MMALASKVSSRPLAMRSILAPSARCAPVAPFRTTCVVVRAERMRLGNLSPSEGSRRKDKRKGRGHAAGQGGTCGFGNNGQKSRAGSGTRPGFEGGQTALYRRLPKLRGIAGGMGAGLPDHVVVNLDELSEAFEANEEVTIQAVKEKVKKVSGREASLPLKVLGTGELTKPLVIKAAAFSETAKAKIEAAGGKTELVAGPNKWTRKAYTALKKELEAKGLDYFKEKAKKRIAALKAKGMIKTRPVKAAKAGKAGKAGKKAAKA